MPIDRHTSLFRVSVLCFTLIEAIVSIVVITLLIAITLPAVSMVRKGARQAQCLANARQCGLAVAAYSGDHDDAFPIFGLRELNVRPTFENGGFVLDYFLQSYHWLLVVGPYLGDQSPASPSPARACPDSPFGLAMKSDLQGLLDDYPRGYVLPSDYWMSAAMFTDPAVWVEGPPLEPTRALLRAVRTAEVRTPSAKALLVERFAHHADTQSPPALASGAGARQVFNFAMADGSARSVAPKDLNPGVRPALPLFPEYSWLTEGTPGITTLGGVHGRDLRSE